MLTNYPLKTYQYLCFRLGAITPVDTYLAYYSDDLPDYPHDAEIPFAATSYRMWCPNAIKCGVLQNRVDGVADAWHLCPALATLRNEQSLPDQVALMQILHLMTTTPTVSTQRQYHEDTNRRIRGAATYL